jgi:drug/metabolite transporter (DMT)-like permease
MTTTTAVNTPQRNGQQTGQRYGSGLLFALGSAASFGMSGALARSLLDLGWSPPAVVAVRVGGAFAVLLVPTLFLLRRIGLPTVRQSGRLLIYGIVAVGLAQLCYFSAVQYLSVGVALLLEYLAPVLLIGWHWARSRQRPAVAVLLGAGLSLVGLALVLDLRSGLTLNPIGVAWGLGAASVRTSCSARTTASAPRFTHCC